MLHIRVFKTTDDVDSCVRYAEGHANVLRDYGVTKVTSSNNEWINNPSAIVVTVEDEEGNMVGGERIHFTHEQFPLPIETAIGQVDVSVYPLVASYAAKGPTGELCGLWNAKSIAGRGVSIFLTKLGVALARVLQMNSLFVLCAPHTVAMCQNAGFEIETSIGNKGTFFYPKLDLVATSLVIKDFDALTGDPAFMTQIMSMINQPIGSLVEHGPKGDTTISYNLHLPSWNTVKNDQ